MERKEPTFSGSNSAPFDSKDRQPAESMAANQRPVASRTESSPKQASSPMAGLSFFLVLVSLAACGYIYSQLQESQQTLTKAGAKIFKLEQQLSLSDNESTQSVASLQSVIKQQQEELKTSNSEIRKLWDTRNVNKKAIANNKETVVTISEDLSKVKPLVDGVEKLNDDVSKQVKTIAALKSGLAAKSTEMTELQAIIAEQKKSMRQLVDSNRQLEADLAEFERKMKNYDETIASIDAFRKNTNSELWRLKQSLSSPAPAPASSPSL